MLSVNNLPFDRRDSQEKSSLTASCCSAAKTSIVIYCISILKSTSSSPQSSSLPHFAGLLSPEVQPMSAESYRWIVQWQRSSPKVSCPIRNAKADSVSQLQTSSSSFIILVQNSFPTNGTQMVTVYLTCRACFDYKPE